MSPLVSLSPSAVAPALRGRIAVRGAADSNSFSTLDERQDGEERASPHRRGGRRQSDLSQIDTNIDEPLWNGPRLKPTFVAQVLGQVMMPERPLTARRPSYRDAALIPTGAIFDAGA